MMPGIHKFSFLVLVGLFFFSFTYPVKAVDYYVSLAGNDANPGTIEKPWKTPSKVNATSFVAGDRILFNRGNVWNYNIMLYGLKGTQDKPIIFGAYGSGNNPAIKNADLRGVSYITLENITFEGNSATGIDIVESSAAPTSYITIKDCIVQNNATFGIAIWLPNAARDGYVTIVGNTIRNNGSNNQWSSGLYSTSSNLTIKGNTIYHNGYGDQDWGYSHGIYVDEFSSNVNVYENEVYGNTRGHGVVSKGSANIYRNIIYDNEIAGVFFGNNQTMNITGNVYNNIVYKNLQGFGLYGRGAGSVTLNIYNNSFYQNNRGTGWTANILIESNLTALNIKNNIFSAASGAYVYDIVSQSKASISNNIVYGKIRYAGSDLTLYGFQSKGFDLGSSDSDPKYVNPPSDFRLQSSSPAIDKGVSVGVTTDFEGNTRPKGTMYDIGAYEYTGTAVPAPSNTPIPTAVPTSILPLTSTPVPTSIPTITISPTSAGGTTSTITPIPTPSFFPADLNRDHVVDMLDYTLLKNNYGQKGCNNIADISKDCTVSMADYNLLIEVYGQRR